MLSLDQVRSLEARVEKALAYIDELTDENAGLRERLGGYEMRIKDLEILVRDFQADQGRIEEGILSALEKLHAFEDTASHKPSLEASAKKMPAHIKNDHPKPLETQKSAEDAIELDESDEIIEEEEVIDPSSDEQKPSGELDIF